MRLAPTERMELIALRARGLYADVCAELERTDPYNRERCLLLRNVADALDEFTRGCGP